MSKKEKKIITVLLIIGVIIVGVALILLPSEIPFHFNAKGKAEWFASKYFLLILIPVPALVYITNFRNKKKK
ncbi:hypothetical protein IMSAGC013_02275 [Lachnospiraceae bacterium]|jgi:uncharacterized membrane protein|nr:hypothetical protein IMSAGC013_02275 [Lachnospiraceae bacterium]